MIPHISDACSGRWFRRFLYLILPVFAFGLYSCKHKAKAPPLFQLLDSAQTHIKFNNNLSDSDYPGILNYLYFYNGCGVAVGDINNDGLPDIFFTSNKKGGNKLYLNKGNFRFEDITAKAGVAGTADWCTGVTMADVNNDGYLDIYVCAISGKLGFKGHNMLYINNHDGTFTEESAKYGLDFSGYSTQAAFFDYNHDGKLDCYLLNQSNHSSDTYGDTSLRRKVNKMAGSRLFLNENGRFVDVTEKAGIYSSALGYGLGVSVADLNNDGWDDIYEGNDFHENDYYYINNHNGTFTESGAKHFNHYSRFSMGNDIADFNNDGQLDIVTADMLPADEVNLKSYIGDETYDQYKTKILDGGYQYQYSRNCLQKNLRNGQAFSDVGLMDGVAATDWSWTPLLADFDNDGIKDLFVANGTKRRPTDMDYLGFISNIMVQGALQTGHGLDNIAIDKMPPGLAHCYMFKGTSSEKFEDVSLPWGFRDSLLSNGAAYADLNNDGHLDLVINNMDHAACIYRNVSKTGNFLSIRFKGRQDNDFGIGAKAYVFCGRQMQYEELMLTRGFESSVEPKLHFGVGANKKIDSILIVWPNQTWQKLKDIKANQLLTIDQKNAGGHFIYRNFFPSKKPSFQDITAATKVNWKHHEDDFEDFQQQPFIPHMLSTEGPRIAVADVNHDGLDDFYICGAKDQPGALFIQNPDGTFRNSPQPDFVKDAVCEDVDALFADVNHDGFPDLYVASGGNEWPAGANALADRLYINDGKGNFKRSDAIPALKFNKAAVAVADINHDGYPDLFVADAPDGFRFGVMPQNHLLMNDGRGHFTEAAIPDELKNAGMLRSVAFADLNDDGWPDLVVAGEWTPVKIFMNHKGTFTELHNQDVDRLKGWWQRVLLTDVDGDGKIDIVAGNYGLNSKLHPTNSDPVKLFLSDLDNNGTIDPILTYSVDQKDYTFLGKGDIEKLVPLIKKKYPTYRDFAGKTVQQIFGEYLTDQHPLTANSFASGVFYNKGNGNFEFKAFPRDAQMSPLFGFAAISSAPRGLLAGGNFWGVTPNEGRYDADYGDVLWLDSKGAVHWESPVSSGFELRGEVRDIKALKTAKGLIYVVAFNNNYIRFFKPVN